MWTEIWKPSQAKTQNDARLFSICISRSVSQLWDPTVSPFSWWHFLKPWCQLPYCIFDYSTRKSRRPNVCGWLDLSLKTMRFGNKKINTEINVIKWKKRKMWKTGRQGGRSKKIHMIQQAWCCCCNIVPVSCLFSWQTCITDSGPRHDNNLIRLERRRGPWWKQLKTGRRRM